MGAAVTVDRGVSFPLTHVVTLGIALVVVTTLLYSAGTFVAGERSHTARVELTQVGSGLVTDVVAVDRAVDGSDSTSMTVAVDLPRRVSGGTYRAALHATGGPAAPGNATVEVSALDIGASVALPFRNRTPVANSSAAGGRLYVVYQNRTISIADRP